METIDEMGNKSQEREVALPYHKSKMNEDGFSSSSSEDSLVLKERHIQELMRKGKKKEMTSANEKKQNRKRPKPTYDAFDSVSSSESEGFGFFSSVSRR